MIIYNYKTIYIYFIIYIIFNFNYCEISLKQKIFENASEEFNYLVAFSENLKTHSVNLSNIDANSFF